jgi:hypothetical protein
MRALKLAVLAAATAASLVSAQTPSQITCAVSVSFFHVHPNLAFHGCRSQLTVRLSASSALLRRRSHLPAVTPRTTIASARRRPSSVHSRRPSLQSATQWTSPVRRCYPSHSRRRFTYIYCFALCPISSHPIPRSNQLTPVSFRR